MSSRFCGRRTTDHWCLFSTCMCAGTHVRAHSLTWVCHTHTLSTHIKSSDFVLIIVVIPESGRICLLGTMAGEVSPRQLLHAMLFNPLLDREHFVCRLLCFFTGSCSKVTDTWSDLMLPELSFPIVSAIWCLPFRRMVSLLGTLHTHCSEWALEWMFIQPWLQYSWLQTLRFHQSDTDLKRKHPGSLWGKINLINLFWGRVSF